MTTQKGILFRNTMLMALSLTLLLLLGGEVMAQTFVHKTSTDNIKGHMTTLSNSQIDGKADKLLFVSQLYGQYNSHQIGVWYDRGKWLIYNEDKAKMPSSTMFNVIALNPSDFAFSHKASKTNITDNWTMIDHPKCNNNPNAILFITQNWKSTYNPKAIGVWYTNGKWAIYNQDRSAMPVGTNYNVMVVNEGVLTNIVGGRATILTANGTSKKSGAGKHVAISNASDQNTLLFVTQNWQSSGVYNNHVISTWKSQGKWTVYNQDQKELPDNSKFNLLLVSTVQPKYVRIQNRWQKDGKTDYKINIEGSKVDAGATQPNWSSAQWAFERVENTKNLYRIRNRWQKDGKTNYYLHNQNGKLEASAIEPGWWSAQWSLEKVGEGDFYRIRNRWKNNEYLHIEGEHLESSPMELNWWSAQWDLGNFE